MNTKAATSTNIQLLVWNPYKAPKHANPTDKLIDNFMAIRRPNNAQRIEFNTLPPSIGNAGIALNTTMNRLTNMNGTKR
jgi:hypothetical protein